MLTSTLTGHEIEIINYIYGHFLGTGEWQGVRTINLRFGKSKVEKILRNNPPLIIKEESGSNKRSEYKLTFEGICICPAARPSLLYLDRYLKLLTDKFHQNPEIQSISGLEIEKAMGLGKPQSRMLQELIRAGHFFGNAGFGEHWVIGVPADIEDLAELGPEKYLEKHRKMFHSMEPREREAVAKGRRTDEDVYDIFEEEFAVCTDATNVKQAQYHQKSDCFVILPIGKEGTVEYQNNMAVYNKIIEPCVRSAGFNLRCYHADLIDRSGDISKQVIEALRNDPVVIADLRRSNPNVIYELGIRHAFGKRSIIICSEHTESFFHTTKYRAIRYKLDGASNQDFFNRLRNQIQDIMSNPEKNDNPVTDILEFRLADGGFRNNPHSELLYLSRKSKGQCSLGELFNTSAEDILDLKITYIGNFENKKIKVINSFDDPVLARSFNPTIIKQKETFHIVDFPRTAVKVKAEGVMGSTKEKYSQFFDIATDDA